MTFENSTGTAMGDGAMHADYYCSKREMIRAMMCRIPQSADDRDFFHMKAIAWERGMARRPVSIKRRRVISGAHVTPFPQPKRYNFPVSKDF